MIGPYATNDDRVLDYHFELMKLAKVDGIILDWYGELGSNGDIDQASFHESFGPKTSGLLSGRGFSKKSDPTTFLYFAAPDALNS